MAQAELSDIPNRIAVVLFNLGGPDSLDAVEPFLFNLFNDPAIIAAPSFVRFPLAKFIARRRAPLARDIYREIGGKSPLLEQTEDQAQALAEALDGMASRSSTKPEFRAFTVMRYWHPRARAVIEDVKEYEPDQIVLLPLYPQFSTTTSLSSINEWKAEAVRAGLRIPTTSICCYPRRPELASAQAGLIQETIGGIEGPLKILFSAHGLPEKVIEGGDPYQRQVEETVEEILAEMSGRPFSHVVCYQSRVGPLKWIGPSTEDEIVKAAKDGVHIVIVPVAFVSEHSETLVELDIEYRKLADDAGAPGYSRVPALHVRPAFINGLAEIVRDAVEKRQEGPFYRGDNSCQCGQDFLKCPAWKGGQGG